MPEEGKTWYGSQEEIWRRLNNLESNQGKLINQEHINSNEIGILRSEIPKINVLISDMARQFASLSSSGSTVAIEARRMVDGMRSEMTSLLARFNDFERQKTAFDGLYDRQYIALLARFDGLATKEMLKAEVASMLRKGTDDISNVKALLNQLKWWVGIQGGLIVVMIGLFVERSIR